MQFRKNILLLVLFQSFCGLSAQNFQLAGLNFSQFSKSEVKNSPSNQQVKFQEINFFLKIPVKFKNNKTILMNTFRYGMVSATAFDSPLFSDSEFNKNLHSVAYSPILIHKISEKWMLAGTITPTLASDFGEKLSGDDLLFQGMLLALAKPNDKITTGGGVVYTTQLGAPRFLPLAQFRFYDGRHFLNIFLPTSINYSYAIGEAKKWRVGVRAATNGGNFNVDNRDFTEIIPNSINKLLYSRVNLGPVINCQLTDKILMEASGGVSAGRKYKFEDASKNYFNYNSENSPFFNIGIFLTNPADGGVDN
jgi:hypothetical protein